MNRSRNDMYFEDAVLYHKELDKWKDDIKDAFEKIIINFLKNSYPYITDIADITFDNIFTHDDILPIDIVLFMKPEYIHKGHEKVDKEIKTILEMMLLDKRKMSWGNTLTTRLRVYAVESE